MKSIRINVFDPASIQDAISELQEYRKWLTEKTDEFVKALGDNGVHVASVRFGDAIYDGTNDVKVSIEERGENAVAVVATGNATLFIEFGTGILYPDIHPESGELGMTRGQYGYGRGGNVWGWTYEGQPGSNGMVINSGRQRGRVHTFGNPANMPMYYTVRELEEMFETKAKEIFAS